MLSKYPDISFQISDFPKKLAPSFVSLHFTVEQFYKLSETICKIVSQVGKSVNCFSASMKDAKKYLTK